LSQSLYQIPGGELGLEEMNKDRSKEQSDGETGEEQEDREGGHEILSFEKNGMIAVDPRGGGWLSSLHAPIE
jgi:hypothetical protein